MLGGHVTVGVKGGQEVCTAARRSQPRIPMLHTHGSEDGRHLGPVQLILALITGGVGWFVHGGTDLVENVCDLGGVRVGEAELNLKIKLMKVQKKKNKIEVLKTMVA